MWYPAQIESDNYSYTPLNEIEREYDTDDIIVVTETKYLVLPFVKTVEVQNTSDASVWYNGNEVSNKTINIQEHGALDILFQEEGEGEVKIIIKEVLPLVSTLTNVRKYQTLDLPSLNEFRVYTSSKAKQTITKSVYGVCYRHE
jgi:hypothetical protein